MRRLFSLLKQFDLEWGTAHHRSNSFSCDSLDKATESKLGRMVDHRSHMASDYLHS